ncbi:CinY protein [Streptomyces sp. MS2.AVA.5]|uniref:CinY protein n=1 Tax=Streptomyces achmelvichensis TaxID=3134111 RepID=A0ACC6PL87_9ACTN
MKKSRFRLLLLPLAGILVSLVTLGSDFTASAADFSPALRTEAQPPPVEEFGTINGLGQSAEHEKITRSALACRGGEPANACFQPSSLTQLSGRSGTFGAVGAPDSDQTLTEAAHCDGADYLNAPGYPRMRTQATASLLECIQHLRVNLSEGVVAAEDMLNAERLDPDEVDLRSTCTFTLSISGRGKCNAIEGLGRALHGTQDFYSHSNWSDSSDPSRTVGINNPPGLARSVPAPFMNLVGSAPTAASIPAPLSTGCFSLFPWGCGGRVTHDVLNKDHGVIDPLTGTTSNPATPRGRVSANFDRAVRSAILDTQAQWKGYRDALEAKYGTRQGALLACAITHDNPTRDCS